METDEIHRLTAIEEKHWLFRERRHILAEELRGLGTPGRALDIGAAGGGNTRVLLDHGWDTLASDFSETAVRIARERGVDAVYADARDLPLESGSFDLVTAFDVLEHIEEDHLAAAEIFRILRPGGTALITVPCDMRLWSAHDVAVGHVRRYTRESLTKVVEEAGFVIDRLWSWNVLLRPAVALYRRRSTGSDLFELPWIVNACLRGVITLERCLPVKSFKGVSLVLRMHKP